MISDYGIEDPDSGFTSIPKSIYWAIVTLATVGYGDITPRTNFGQVVSAIIMIIGFGIIAMPTGIVTAELTQVYKRSVSTQACPQCSAEGHDTTLNFVSIAVRRSRALINYFKAERKSHDLHR